MNLSLQHRLAADIFKCGRRKVWLDPTKQGLISKAKSRSQIRDLIGQNVIQHVPSHRGRRDGLTKMHQNRDYKTLKLRAEWEKKVQNVQKAGMSQGSASGKADEVVLEEL